MNPEHKAPQNLSRHMDGLCLCLFLIILAVSYFMI